MEKSSKSPENKIQTEQMAVGYGSRPLISEIALQVRTGQIVTLIGPNGAGKSTLMNILTGLHKADNGTILVDGKRLDVSSQGDYIEKSAPVIIVRVEGSKIFVEQTKE